MLAKLLANEDITIQHGACHTASFDIMSRTLTLPQWANSSPEVIDMLVAHEVGHALFTTEEYYKDEIKSKSFFGYLNILEDIRIEKFMKAKYPGIRKTFNVGYGQLNEKDFFGVKTKDLKDLILIDKINLYFKAGFTCGVSFTPEEKVFVHRAERTTTIQEIIDLAKDMHDFTKDEIESEEAQQELEDDVDGDIDIDGYGDSEDGMEEQENATQSEPQQKKSDKTQPITNTQFERKVSELSDTSIVYNYLTLGEFDYEPFVSHKEVTSHINKMKSLWGDQFASTNENAHIKQFKLDATPTVNYLVKEFEMKKAATLYKRATVSKVGQLDTRKLHAYKLKDDIFKRITTVPEGKNHGMLFLLDWSGSMDQCIQQTVDQVINLVMFCKKAQIKFQVLAFTDNYDNNESLKTANKLRKYVPGVGSNVIDPNSNGLSLLEMFSSEMSNSEFNNMITELKSPHFYSILRLGSTPLNEALIHMYRYAPMFKNKFNLEKLTLITLTDGGADSIKLQDGMHIASYRYDDKKVRVNVKNVLVDTKTKKHYEIDTRNGSTSSNTTNVLLRLIKNSIDITIIGFYLTRPNSRYLESAVISNSTSEDHEVVAARLKTEMSKNGYSTLGGSGRDELFIIPLKTDIKQFSLEGINGTKTAAQIAREFGKSFNNTKKSRILLNKFIDYVA